MHKVYSVKYCRRYSKKGYNSRIYKVEKDNIKDSNKSKE